MAMASMRRPEYKQRSILARWSSATTSGVKSVGAKDFVSKRLGNRDLKGVGLIDLYLVTLDENPAATSVRLPKRGVSTAEQRKQKIRSIAVLPFADLSAERDQEHFSDGVAEEILNALSKVGGLHVPARTSCFAFRGATLDAREIGQRLGVETLLDGSIRKSGKRVRISVQLVDASNGYQLVVGTFRPRD